MFVDPSAGELYLAVSGPVTTLHRAPYTSESVGPAELLGEVPLTDADDLLLLPDAGVLVIPSGRVDGKAGLFSLAGAPASTVEGALADRTNVVALPRAGANVIALGGPSGVVVGSVSDGAFTQYGQTLLSDVADTFVRTVMDGTVLVVGDRAGLRTLETPNELDAPWTELDRLDFEGGTAMESGALVPCP